MRRVTISGFRTLPKRRAALPYQFFRFTHCILSARIAGSLTGTMKTNAENPPINELIIGLYFDRAIPPFRSEHVGLF